MPSLRLNLISVRSTKQGQRINSGKDEAEYQSLVTTLSMNENDMQTLGVESGAKVVVRSAYGQAEFTCEQGKLPQGMIIVPYGPPTCRLYTGDTDGTGMPTTKGWEVEVEASPS